MSKENLPSYANPPVQEVVCGVRFKEIGPFGTPHYGLYWQRIRERFPRFEEVPPLALSIPGQPHEAGAAVEVGPLPPLRRLWYVHADEDRLIQLQNDGFLYNWRRTASSSEYPRFSTVYAEFCAELAELDAFLRDSDLPERADLQYEVTYINHIPQAEGWDELSGIARFSPHLTAPPMSTAYGSLRSLDYRLVFALPEAAGQLTTRIRHAMRKSDARPLLTMEVIARGSMSDPPEVRRDEWFDIAHRAIVKGFAEFTSQEVQDKQWGRER